MTAGLGFLVLALAAFAWMGVLHKLGDRLGGHPARITAALFVTSFAVAVVRAVLGPGLTGSANEVSAAGLAVPFGLLAAAAVWTFQAGVRHGRIATSWLLLNLSVALPTGLSIALYGEPVGLNKGIALGLIAASVVLMWWDRRGESGAGLTTDQIRQATPDKEA